ncbi:MAG: SMP-30/gluconolactonase/LRE family protein [Anaerolineae bacterium]|nr:SMP-30/gluconolactonase/LRE family protein [Anaerolineae bacterium]
MTDSPEAAARTACRLGENPLWNPFDQKLYWLDILAGAIYRFDPQAGGHEVFHRGGVAGGFTLQADGSLLLFGVGGAVHRLRDGMLQTVLSGLPGEEGNRFNDAIADPAGRVLSGTIPYAPESTAGALYRFDSGFRPTKLRENVGLSNGMGFSPDARTFYHTDSKARTIDRYDYDADAGRITNRRTFAQHPDSQSVPDGLTVDAEGFVWSAVWDGACIVRYDPAGRVERRIGLPAKKVTSLIFGGEDYRDLYVTTAGGDDPAQNGPNAGALFRLRPGVQGKPEYLSRV